MMDRIPDDMPVSAIVLTTLILMTGIISAYYGGRISKLPIEYQHTPWDEWHRICRSPGLTELVFASFAVCFGAFLATWHSSADPVSAAMRSIMPVSIWSALLICTGGVQAIAVLTRQRAIRIFCSLVNLWIFLFIQIALVWSHTWIPGIFTIPCFAVWCGFLSTLAQKEQPPDAHWK